MGLGHAGRDGAHALLGDEFDVDAGVRVGVAQVEDELGEVLDGVDVVVRRRGDEPDVRGGDAHLGDPRVHLLRGQLAALAGLGALGHLDLDVGAVVEVVAGHAEATRCDLLDGGAPPVAAPVAVEAGRVLATLTGVGHRAEPVHGDGQRLVGLGGDGAVGHGARREAGDDGGDGLDLVERDRRAVGGELEHAAQGGQAGGLVVDGAGVVAEDRVLAGAGGVLELEDGLRVEQVVLALAAPLVLAAEVEVAVGELLGAREEGGAVAGGDVGGELVEADTRDG